MSTPEARSPAPDDLVRIGDALRAARELAVLESGELERLARRFREACGRQLPGLRDQLGLLRREFRSYQRE